MNQRKYNPPSFVYPWQKHHISRGCCEVAAKRCTKKCGARVVFVFCLLLLHVLATKNCSCCFQRLDYSSFSVVTYHRESDFLKACNAM